MALKFTLKTERIEFSDGDYIEVRGLALPDIVQLVDAHKADIAPLFDRFTGRDPNTFTLEDSAKILPELIMKIPTVAAHIIALAADAAEQYSEVLKLPVDVQVMALEKIALLTFASSGGAKNFVETVLRIAKGANGLKENLSPRQN